MLNSNFWDNSELSDKIVNELKNIKSIIFEINNIYNKIINNIELLNSLNLISDDEILLLISDEYDILNDSIFKLEINTFFNGEYDKNNAIIEIHSGAGGTESCDWVNMLYRMYSRYANKKGFNLVEIDKQYGDEAGLKSVMFQINGINAYGYMKNEKGIHRLVRISPFDSNKRRHTSFAAIDVMPEIDDDIDIEINDCDIRVDIYRSSGPGGQGVNTTDSAVRITHIPTGIVVTCQNERSQIRNKEKALEVLKSKLYLIEIEKQNEKINGIRGEQQFNGFGSAKRSYVLEPYKLIKDNDSGFETSNVDSILDGDLDNILEFAIKNKKEV